MKLTVTYSCGHEAEIKVFGSRHERERKIWWAENRGLCPDCYKAEQKACGPTVYVRRVPGYDPAEGVKDAEACIAKAEERLTKAPVPEHHGCGREGRRYECDQQERARAESDKAYGLQALKQAQATAPRDPAIEIYITNSYDVREQLKARGYRFSKDRYSLPDDFLALKPCPAWGWQSSDPDAIASEIRWLKEQGWTMEAIGAIQTTLQALTDGRPDLAGLPT